MPRLPIAVTKPKRKRKDKKFTGRKNDENLFHFELLLGEILNLPKKVSTKKKKVTRRRHTFKKGQPNKSSKY
jgi:hypothetical protein